MRCCAVQRSVAIWLISAYAHARSRASSISSLGAMRQGSLNAQCIKREVTTSSRAVWACKAQYDFDLYGTAPRQGVARMVATHGRACIPHAWPVTLSTEVGT